MRRSDRHSQLPLFEGMGEAFSANPSAPVINVAMVPQRSPFRYPGGKTWLVPKFREWVKSLSHKPKIFIEPFAGGGIISLTVAFENLADRIIMVEIDDAVSAVWSAILGQDAKWLAEKIMSFNLTIDSAHKELKKAAKSTRQRAFQTLFKNRIYHGGILAPGSGLIRNGEKGKGILSRWYPKTLAKRIMAIDRIKGKISFIHGDGVKMMKKYQNDDEAVFFIDPPYTASAKKAGKRLYKHNSLDHEELFHIAKNLAGGFLMTYDNDQGVIQLARKFDLKFATVQMNNTHHATMEELLIGKNIDWVKNF